MLENITKGVEMREYKERVKKITRKECIRIHCDMCDKTIDYEHEEWKPALINNSLSNNKVIVETNIELKENCGDMCGGEYEEISFDVCAQCFVDHLVPFIKNFKNREPYRASRHY